MEWVLFIIFLLASAFYSSSEIAFVAANQLKFVVKTQLASPKAKSKYFIYTPSKYLSTTLVGNNVVMVATSSLAALLFAPYMPGPVQIIITTIALLLFGEIIPKTIGQQIPNRLTLLLRIFMTVSYYLFYFLVLLAESFSKFLIKIFGGESNDVELFFKKADLPILFREYFNNEFSTERGQRLVDKAIQISDKKVHDIMIHRTDIVAIDSQTLTQDLLNIFQKSGYSRIPVFKESIDEIIGIIYLFDILRPNIKSYKRSIRKAVFIPETLQATKALKRLRDEQKSIAMVIDEHGGIAGMVTIEDLIEELFGAINDEYDVSKKMMKKSSKSLVLAGGKTEVSELNDEFLLNIPNGDYITIGGFISYSLQRIPKEGDKVSLSNADIIVTKADSVRVLEVKIILSPENVS
jgi:putative hemolysin